MFRRWELLLLLIITKLFVLSGEEKKIKALHLGFHTGCIEELNYVAKEFGFDITNWLISDLSENQYGVPRDAHRYNVTHNMATLIWEKNQDFFNQFDLIITSDTAPLSRIFLQNSFSKPLIIWVCNRFDYYDGQYLTEPFPDEEYFNLIRNAPQKPNVRIVSYTPFEHLYAQKYRSVDFGSKTIKPMGISWKPSSFKSSIPISIDKSASFFVPNYHNDAILPKFLDLLQIPYYQGRYSGPYDLKEFKGIIHVPYAWSNLALFENLCNGMIYFIPTKQFLLQLHSEYSFFWFQNFDKELLTYSEWYLPDHCNLFVYFDSWKDLEKKVRTTDYKNLREKILEFSKVHKNKMLEEWESTLTSLNLTP